MVSPSWRIALTGKEKRLGWWTLLCNFVKSPATYPLRWCRMYISLPPLPTQLTLRYRNLDHLTRLTNILPTIAGTWSFYNATAHEDWIVTIDEYNKPDSEKFIFLLTIRADGLSLDLTWQPTLWCFMIATGTLTDHHLVAYSLLPQESSSRFADYGSCTSYRPNQTGLRIQVHYWG